MKYNFHKHYIRTISIPSDLGKQILSHFSAESLNAAQLTCEAFCFILHVYKHIFTFYSEKQILPV